MAQNIRQRLEQLRSRRQGTDRITELSEQARIAVLAGDQIREAWQDRASEQQPHTRWVLGAMQRVDDNYTRISIETAKRVGNQLKRSLDAAQRQVDFRLQGSVPLDVHIRGVSDVDLLTIDCDFRTYALAGHKARTNQYGPRSSKTSIDVLSSLRSHCERTLRDAFQAAKVDANGSKAIKISGGSLARPVDVVPSHWNDTVDYQSTTAEHDRAVTILDKSVPMTIDNLPFKHIKLIKASCDVAAGGLRKSIRLCKHVKADLEQEGSKISLSSFDIASIMYHADLQILASGRYFELAILTETQRHLDYLYGNQDYAKTLLVPDGTRRIFDASHKFSALLSLSVDMDRLVREVWKEQSPNRNVESGMLAAYRDSLKSVIVR
ncbi:hypothetical protein [Dokdonella sp.]|uniref:hypothetical protein n=1 Tax=Dokdonella sp. TaxID=2291710 RepID=UPI003527AE81